MGRSLRNKLRLLRQKKWPVLVGLLALAYRAGQEAGWFPQDATVFPLLVLALVGWVFYIGLSTEFAAKRANWLYKRYEGKRAVQYCIVMLCGGVLGAGLAGIGWKLFELNKRRLDASGGKMANQAAQKLPVIQPPPSQSPPPKSASVFDSTIAEWRLENEPESLELHDLFLTDFKSVQQKAYGAIFVDDAKTISVQYAINVELALRSKFLSFYVGRQDQHTAEICRYLADHFRFVLDSAPQLLIEQKTPGDSGTISTKEAVFSDRIYVYHETYLPAETTVALSNRYRHHGISAIFRSVDYLATKKLEASVRKLRRTQAAP